MFLFFWWESIRKFMFCVFVSYSRGKLVFLVNEMVWRDGYRILF